MKKARKKLQKLEENKKTGIFVIIFFSLCIAGGGFFYLLQPEKNIEFEKVFTKVTNMYYETGFIQGKEREKICREVERKLQNLLDLYQEEENQRRILLLLALNAQLQKEEERAVFYFEQLRIYHPNFEETYGEYGNYLIQIGDKEKNRKLWIEYFNKEKKGIFDRDKSKNTKVWADYMEKEMKQENEEK